MKGVYKRNKIWYIGYSHQGFRYRERVGSDKKVAENALHKRKVEIAENRFLDVRRKRKFKFEDLAQQYLEVYAKPNKKSWKSDVQYIKTLSKYFTKIYLYQITPLAVEKFKLEEAKKVSPATVNRTLTCLKCMLNKAVEWDKLDGNPIKTVRLFKENNRRLRYLEKEEITKLLNNCDGYLKAIVIVALNTGMRRGEILNLKWNDVDFKQDIIYLLDTKNNGRREIPMNIFVKTTFIKVKKHPESPYIFCNLVGNPLRDIRKSFFTALKNADIINFRFHDLRHTFASQLVMSGVDLNTVRELMGHKSLAMTLRYSHLSSDHKKRAVDILVNRNDTDLTQAQFIQDSEEQEVLATL